MNPITNVTVNDIGYAFSWRGGFAFSISSIEIANRHSFILLSKLAKKYLQALFDWAASAFLEFGNKKQRIVLPLRYQTSRVMSTKRNTLFINEGI